MTTATTERQTITAGDIWYSSGGYEQTNIKFYRVLRTTKTMVILETINTAKTEEGRSMCGHATPDESWASGTEDIKRKVHWYRDCPCITIDNYSMGASARPWDGTPKYFSTYA